jgi:hypothetical protein
MPDRTVPAVERLCVHTVQLAHPPREVRKRSPDEQMSVVPHQAARVDDPCEAANALHQLERKGTVVAIEVDRLPTETWLSGPRVR